MNRICPVAILLCAALCGCTFFQTEPTPPAESVIVRQRMKEIQQTGMFICFCESERIPSAEELRDVTTLAEKLGLMADLRTVPAIQIPALLRSGKGDLAICTDNPATIHLDSVTYGTTSFAVRPDAHSWKSKIRQVAEAQ